jgi:1,4-dihydroxy-2-naphthoyl-CoA hydrolase
VSSAFPQSEIVESATVFASESRVVRFQDVDAASTIYFPRVLEYFGDVYLALLTKAGLDVPGMLRRKEMAAPLAHAEADFMAPLFFGDAVEVELVKAKLGRTSATFGHRIKKGGAVASVGTTVHIFVDGGTFKPIDVPAGLRALVDSIGA